jgi:beta-xylosidase
MYSNNETLGVYAVTGNNTSIFIVNWNVMGDPIQEYTVQVTVTGVDAEKVSAVSYPIDDSNANSYPLWVSMGQPMYLSPKQVKLLNKASELVEYPVDLTVVSKDSVEFTVNVPANALVNVILK